RPMADTRQAVRPGRPPDGRAGRRAHPARGAGRASFSADQAGSRGLAEPLRAVAAAASDATTPLPGKTASDIDLHVGRRFGDYELLEEIARGGMGVVYKARQISLGRIVALKMILAAPLAC